MSESLSLIVSLGNEILTGLFQLLALFVIFVGIMRALFIFLLLPPEQF